MPPGPTIAPNPCDYDFATPGAAASGPRAAGTILDGTTTPGSGGHGGSGDTHRYGHGGGGRRPAPARPGAAGPRRRRNHPAGDAHRPTDRAGHRRRDRRGLPARRRRRRRGAPAGLPRDPDPRGLLLVQPHLRQRRPRPVAAPAALHGRQPRPLDAARRRPARAHRTHLRPRGAADRPQPHRPADRRGLRGGARPGRLAVRRRPGLRRPQVLARLHVTPRPRLVEPARPPPRPGLTRAHRPRRTAVVPVQPHLERVRVTAPAAPAGGRVRPRRRQPRRPLPARLLVRAPDRRPAARRPHRRELPDRRGGPHRGHRRLRPRAGRQRPPRRLRVAAAGTAGRGRAARGVRGVPPGPQREQARRRTGPGHHRRPARDRPRPARPGDAVRRLVPARLGLPRATAGRRDVRNPRARPGRPRRRPGRLRRGAAPHRARRAHPAARSRRPGRRHAGLRAGRGALRRGRPARRGLARRRRHARHGARPDRRTPGAAVLAGRGHPRRAAHGGAGGPVLRRPGVAGAAAAGAHRARRLPRGAARRGAHPQDRGRDRPCRADRLRPRHRRPRRPVHPPPRRRRGRRGLGHRAGAGTGRRRHARRRRGRRPDRAGARLLADGPGVPAAGHLGPPRLPQPLRPPHHRHPVGRRHLLAARRPPLRAPLLRRAGRPRPDLADGDLDPAPRRAAGDLRPLAGQRAGRRRGLAGGPAHPRPGRPADLRLTAGAAVRALVPRLLRHGRTVLPARRGALLAQPVAVHRPHRRPHPAAGRHRPRGRPRRAQGPARLRPHPRSPAARPDPRPLGLPGRPRLLPGAGRAAGPPPGTAHTASEEFRQVLRVEQRQLVRTRIGELRHPARVPLHHGLESLPGGPAVAERRALGERREVLQQRLGRPLADPVLVLLRLLLHDPQQLLRGVVAEGDGA
ncbi:integral membrane protein [Streptomyces sparsogenes DSM 40356]|uniref:Integral membrane protein n=1 Tax=Streptomyces sparsogenes DSM 40356 TaxID=1331668 RepID=A0A1R1SD25_9ACTN|nr:integral membrane protein [Streptomyces sparsogenes DSM 40356]